MLISVPDTLTVNNSDKYIMSIRLQPDGLSFSGYIPFTPGSFFFRRVELNRSLSYSEALKEFFFAHDFLTWTYKKVRIVVDTPQYTPVPDAVFIEKQKENFLDFNFSHPENKCLYDKIEDEGMVIVYGINNETYEFCARSFIDPLFIHSASTLFPYWKRQSVVSPDGKMYAVLSPKRIDIFCYQPDKVTFINSFTIDSPEDIIYYILYVWRSTGMDQHKDLLFLYGEGEEGDQKGNIIETISKYLRHAEIGAIPSDAYLLGEEIIHTPMDLVALSICES
ncbi:DUF3822 family protein [Parabacteroides sp. OttesenSCG-928-G06]|nr:DUF3822 family protein [Parabacteroides sp. OttesenSCG-928-K15]MDL2282868.1 DUF3822 family protein [Parabacteroides sp. OttesenSCG-928-G06]